MPNKAPEGKVIKTEIEWNSENENYDVYEIKFGGGFIGYLYITKQSDLIPKRLTLKERTTWVDYVQF